MLLGVSTQYVLVNTTNCTNERPHMHTYTSMLWLLTLVQLATAPIVCAQPAPSWPIPPNLTFADLCPAAEAKIPYLCANFLSYSYQLGLCVHHMQGKYPATTLVVNCLCM